MCPSAGSVGPAGAFCFVQQISCPLEGYAGKRRAQGRRARLHLSRGEQDAVLAFGSSRATARRGASPYRLGSAPLPHAAESLSGNNWASGRQVIQPSDKRCLLIEQSIPLFARGITVDIPLDVIPIYQGF
jgi:hypothetical protein